MKDYSYLFEQGTRGLVHVAKPSQENFKRLIIFIILVASPVMRFRVITLVTSSWQITRPTLHIILLSNRGETTHKVFKVMHHFCQGAM